MVDEPNLPKNALEFLNIISEVMRAYPDSQSVPTEIFQMLSVCNDLPEVVNDPLLDDEARALLKSAQVNIQRELSRRSEAKL